MDRSLIQPATEELVLGDPKRIKDPITLYSNQQNIGKLLVQKYQSLGALPSMGGIKEIYVLMIGPSFVALSKQTKEDLERFVAGRRSSSIKYREVINNASLGVDTRGSVKPGYPADKFLKALKSDKETLFVLIHDEAHHSIGSKSIINNFLKEVCNVIKEENVSLLVLCVSATCEVLTRGVDRIKNDPGEFYHVDWYKLRTTYPDTYGAPSYKSILDLGLKIDDEFRQLCQDNRLTIASEELKASYIKALNFIEHGSELEHGYDQISREILEDLINSVDQGDNRMAVVRAMSIRDANDLAKRLVPRLNYYHIYVVTFVDGPSISQQLEDQGKSNPDKKYKSIYDLDDGVYFVILVDKVRMGERVPKTCFHWDVRCRYRGKNKIENRATLIQDVGRCAGHHKPNATLYVGIDTDNFEEPVNFGSWDRLLRRMNDPKPKEMHPEFYDNGAYSQLVEQKKLLLLDAEPQIGKTGAILSMLKEIDDKLSSSRQKGPEPSSSDNDSINDITREMYRIGKARNRQSALQYIGSRFKEYHTRLKTTHKNWGDYSPVKVIAGSIANDFSDQESLTILDAGCGSLHLAEYLKSELESNEYDCNIRRIEYIAMDVPSREDWATTLSDEINNWCSLDIQYYPGDYLTSFQQMEPESCDCVVFSLSFSTTDDVTEEIKQAYKVLKNEGKLFIAAMKHRFPYEFKRNMLHNGFKQSGTHHTLRVKNTTLQLRVFEVRKQEEMRVEIMLEPKFKND